MILISHRGNISGRIPERENTQEYIDDAIKLGYDVEIDVRETNNKLYLGHDNPDYEINLDWLLDRRNKLWIHTKNFEALSKLIDFDLRIFFHEKENQTIINKCDLIWSHDLTSTNNKSIIPLLDTQDINNYNFSSSKVYGICTDYILIVKTLI